MVPEVPRFILIIILINITLSNAQFGLSIKPEISHNSWKISYINKIQPSDILSIGLESIVFNTNHVHDRYIWYKYSRSDISYTTLVSYLHLDFEYYNLKLGRDFIPNGPGEFAGLFISPKAPPLDHISFKLINFYGISISNTIIRLDNRLKTWQSNENIVQRWYYLRSIGFNHKDILTINFTDAVIATGFNRGLEWYYLNPISLYIMERKHQLHWIDGGDSLSIVGQGDNDNHFIGGNLYVSLGELKIYCEAIIDEWQLTKEYRSHMQTVFGFVSGIGYTVNQWEFVFEYSFASPWLHINRALYGSPEYHRLPLGMRSPQSQSLDTAFLYNFSNEKSIKLVLHFEQRGDQTFNTTYNAWDNKIAVSDFNQTLPIELKLIFDNSQGKYFNTLGLYHNWLQSGTTQFMLGWNFNKTL